MIRKQFSAVLKSVNIEKNTATYLLTTEDVDRDGEITLQSGLDDSDYKGNPIWLWGHEHDGPPSVCIGMALSWLLTPEGWLFTVEYCVAINPVAKLVLDQVNGGFLRAVSIGFIPLEWVTLKGSPEAIEALPPKIKAQLLSGECSCVWTRYKIIEGSNVLLGSNPGALFVRGAAATFIHDLESFLKSGSAAVATKNIEEPVAMKVVATPEEVKADEAPETVSKSVTGAKAKYYGDDCFGYGGLTGYHPKVADVAMRLYAQAQGLPSSLDPDRDGDVDCPGCIQSYIDVLLQCVTELKALGGIADTDGDAEEVAEVVTMASNVSPIIKAGSVLNRDNKSHLEAAMAHAEAGTRQHAKCMKALCNVMKAAGYEVEVPKDFPQEEPDLPDSMDDSEEFDPVLNSLVEYLSK